MSKVASPFHFIILFQGRGSKIDLQSLRVIYLKVPSVDLTDRLRSYISARGIEMPAAETPPGYHRIQVQISDEEGLVTKKEFDLTVIK